MPDDFYREGAEAFLAGDGPEDCPYGEGTDGQEGWKRGYRKAAQAYELKIAGSPPI